MTRCFRYLGVMTFLASVLAAQVSAGGRQTIYVSAMGRAGGTGALDSPFLLRAGREYELNQLIRRATDAGNDVDVVFDDGIYHDVRLQIIKLGIHSDIPYIQEPGADAAGHVSLVAGKPYHYHSYDYCNQQHENCVVKPEDYALGHGSHAALTLEAKHPHQAIFDGAAFQLANPEIDNSGVFIAGEPIENVSVVGLVFRNYRNGIGLRHGLGITINNCEIENIGTHSLKALNDNDVGVAGFSVSGDSQLVLVRDTTIRNVWNIQGITGARQDWPSLMHSIYVVNSRDIIFIDNAVEGSSGPMVKFGYYPRVKKGRLIYLYGDQIWQRRGFFISNHFILSPIFEEGQRIPTFRPMQAFIHDNSEALVNGISTPPAKGMVFINNIFRNLLPGQDGNVVAFLRQELPAHGSYPQFPGFVFAGNRIEGVPPNQVIVHRFRGSEVTSTSIERDDPSSLESPLPALTHQTSEPVDVDTTVAKLMAGPLRSPDDARDQLVVSVIRTGRMARIN
ncbi:MAG: hypothetical protein JO189_10365 [Deltaproteobacteria bacterium]|nr:hypothetical protein [Deltaproteobacteria bacterium]